MTRRINTGRPTLTDIIYQFVCDKHMLTYGWTHSAIQRSVPWLSRWCKSWSYYQHPVWLWFPWWAASSGFWVDWQPVTSPRPTDTILQTADSPPPNLHKHKSHGDICIRRVQKVHSQILLSQFQLQFSSAQWSWISFQLQFAQSCFSYREKSSSSLKKKISWGHPAHFSKTKMSILK